MSIKELEEAFSLLNESGAKVYSLGEFDQKAVDTFERVVGIELPEDYVHFIKKYGAVSFLGEEVYGLTKDLDKAKAIPSSIFLTLEYRRRREINEQMIVIYSYGDRGLVSIWKDNDSFSIIETNLSFKRDGNYEVIAKSFGEFFLELVNSNV